MLNFNVQLNNNGNDLKTLNEIVREAFTVQNPVVDISLFYNERTDYPRDREVKDSKIKFPGIKK